MEPKIVQKEEMTLVGLVGSGKDVTDVDIAGLWTYFDEDPAEIKHQIEGVGYELHIAKEAPADVKRHFCLVGVEVEKIEDLPSEFFAKVLPPTTYAVFTHQFKNGGFSKAFELIYNWLDNSEYSLAYPYDIQRYDDRFKGTDVPESVIEIYVPIK